MSKSGGMCKLVAETVQFLALERLLLQPETNSLDGIEKLAEPVMQLAGIRQGFLRVTRECDLEATGQSRLPIDQMPLAAAKPVFPALDESRLYAEFRADQVPPLVPGRVERERERDRIQDQFCFAPAVTIDRVAIVKLNLPERRPKASLPAIREERQDLSARKRSHGPARVLRRQAGCRSRRRGKAPAPRDRGAEPDSRSEDRGARGD